MSLALSLAMNIASYNDYIMVCSRDKVSISRVGRGKGTESMIALKPDLCKVNTTSSPSPGLVPGDWSPSDSVGT